MSNTLSKIGLKINSNGTPHGLRKGYKNEALFGQPPALEPSLLGQQNIGFALVLKRKASNPPRPIRNPAGIKWLWVCSPRATDNVS